MRLYVACHDKIIVPPLPGYIPIQSGSAVCDTKLNCIRDGDLKDNISARNPRYFELCALYAVAKNLIDDTNNIYGVLQSRRFLVRDYSTHPVDQLNYMHAMEADLANYRTALAFTEEDMGPYDMLCPLQERVVQRTRTLGDNWRIFHDREMLVQARNILAERDPSYLDAFDAVFDGPCGFYHYHNILITKGRLLMEYADWLFRLLMELENRVVLKPGTDYHHNHLDGKYKPLAWLAEHLINVFILRNRLMVRGHSVLMVN